MDIVPYSPEDSEAAIELEKQCPQGESLRIGFLRPTFRARSEVYEDFRILCAKEAGRFIGTVARADKSVKFHGETIRASYIYDLRVHPEHRRYGTAKRLVDAVLEDAAGCIYSMIAGGNELALRFARRCFAMTTVVPLTYVVMPVYRRLKGEDGSRTATACEVHELFLKLNADMQFVPLFYEKGLPGHLSSITLEQAETGGCSIWSNENLMAEQVIRIPRKFCIMRVLNRLCSPFLKLPYVPAPGEIIRSWFLFDFYAQRVKTAGDILRTVNNIALKCGRTFLYILLQSDDELLKILRAAGFRFFTFPYFFLAKGDIDMRGARIYIDVRDL